MRIYMYTSLDWEDVWTLTWRGNPVVQRAKPAAIVKPEDLAFFGETVDMGIGFPGNTSGESGHWPPKPKPEPGPKPKHVPKSRPKPRLEPFHGRGLLPRRGVCPPIGEPRRPIPIPRPREDELRPKTREPVQRHEDEYTRRVIPSTLQKMIKTFDGFELGCIIHYLIFKLFANNARILR